MLEFYQYSVKDFFNNFKVWLPFLPFFFVQNYLTSSIGTDQSLLVYNLILILIYFILASCLTIRFISRIENKMFSLKEYFAGSVVYLLYSTYYLFLVVLGIVLFIIPAFFFGTLFILAPIIVLRESHGNAFKLSWNYLKKHASLAFSLFFLSVLFEVWSFVLPDNPKGNLLFLTWVFMLVDTIVGIYLIKALVDLYYYVKKVQTLEGNT